MQFLNPSILWALFALLIPVIIHLFYFRRFRRVYFTNTQFLQEVKEETRNRSRLRNLLVLLFRLLAFSLLILAFAQPILPTGEKIDSRDKAVSIFIDNSFSMDAAGSEVQLLEEAKRAAKDIVLSYPESYLFHLATHDLQAQHQRLTGREEMLALIDEQQISPDVRMLSEIHQRQKQATSEFGAEESVYYFLSDFQRSICDFDQFQDSSSRIFLVPVQSAQTSNVSIDSCWFDQPVQIPGILSRLYVQLRNHSPEERDNVRLSLRYKDQVKPVGTVNIPPYGSAVDTIAINPDEDGWQRGEIIMDDYPVQFDDRYYFSFHVADQLNILVLNQHDTEDPYLQAAFAGSEFTNVHQTGIQRLQYSSLRIYNLVILNEVEVISSGLSAELRKYVNSGGNVLFFPDRNGDIPSYNAFLRTCGTNEIMEWRDEEMGVSEINAEEFVFNNVFERIRSNISLPTVQSYTSFTRISGREEESLLSFRNGRTYLGKYAFGAGHIYLSAAPLSQDYNDLVSNGEIYVPMLHKMALAATQVNLISHTIGKETGIRINAFQSGQDPIYKVSGAREFIPAKHNLGNLVVLNVEDQIEEAGFYEVNNSDSLLAILAFNYDRTESDLSNYSPEELKEFLSANVSLIDDTRPTSLASLVKQQASGRPLWKYCIVLALICLLLEQLLLRFFRT